MRDARVTCQQVGAGRAASTGTYRGRSRARPEPRLAAGPDRRSARGRRPAVGCRRRRHRVHLRLRRAMVHGDARQGNYGADFHGGGYRGGPEAARETTHERRWHDVIVSTLPAATHRIFMDHGLVGCQDRGPGAEGGCYQQPGERVGGDASTIRMRDECRRASGSDSPGSRERSVA